MHATARERMSRWARVSVAGGMVYETVAAATGGGAARDAYVEGLFVKEDGRGRDGVYTGCEDDEGDGLKDEEAESAKGFSSGVYETAFRRGGGGGARLVGVGWA